jgi:putative redox protein
MGDKRVTNSADASKPPGVAITAATDGLGVRLIHGPSHRELDTQPPKDNGGTGAEFSPTDLVGAALLSCALTTMALAAKRDAVPWGRASGRVEKRMVGDPRRIGELELLIVMPKELPADQRARFEEIGRGCPVARSLSGELKLPIKFDYEG